MNKFKCGRTHNRDKPLSGTSEIIGKIHDMILNDRRMKVRQIVEAIIISHSTLITILHKKLTMKKVSEKWVSRLLTVENKGNRVNFCVCTSLLWNLDPFLLAFDKGTVETVDSTRQSSSEWGKFSEIGRQGDGNGFLGCKQNHLYWLLIKRTNDK